MITCLCLFVWLIYIVYTWMNLSELWQLGPARKPTVPDWRPRSWMSWSWQFSRWLSEPLDVVFFFNVGICWAHWPPVSFLEKHDIMIFQNRQSVLRQALKTNGENGGVFGKKHYFFIYLDVAYVKMIVMGRHHCAKLPSPMGTLARSWLLTSSSVPSQSSMARMSMVWVRPGFIQSLKSRKPIDGDLSFSANECVMVSKSLLFVGTLNNHITANASVCWRFVVCLVCWTMLRTRLFFGSLKETKEKKRQQHASVASACFKRCSAQWSNLSSPESLMWPYVA